MNERIGTSLVVAGTGRVYGVPSGMYVPEGSVRVRDQSSTSMTWLVKVPAKHAVLPALLGSSGPISAPLPLGGPGLRPCQHPGRAPGDDGREEDCYAQCDG